MWARTTAIALSAQDYSNLVLLNARMISIRVALFLAPNFESINAQIGDTMQDALELKRLGEMYVEAGDYESAELLFRKLVGIDEQFAPDSVALSEDLYNLGLLCSALDKNAEARAFLTRAWEIERALLGDSHAETIKTRNALNEVFYDQDSLTKEGQVYSSTRANKTNTRTYH